MNPPSLEQDRPDFAQQLMRQVAARYASCDSYMDEGQVVTAFIDNDEEEFQSSLRPFFTAFVRPANFRFEFRRCYRDDMAWDRHVVWQGGESVSIGRSATPIIETKPTLSLALAGATGISGASSVTIPNLLMPDTVKCNGLLTITDWTLLGEEKVGNTPAYKVHGVGPLFEGINGNLRQGIDTLWIDTRTFLILQTLKLRRTNKDYRTETTTRYWPRMNTAVPDDKLRFDAPA